MAVYRYDTRFNPPAPMLPIEISRPLGPEGQTIEALVDSGSDISFVPSLLADSLSLRKAGETIINPCLGPREMRELWWARVVLQDRDPLVIEVVLWDAPYVLLGRDCLNHWKVTLDGPRGSLGIE